MTFPPVDKMYDKVEDNVQCETLFSEKKSDMKKISEYLHHHLEEGIDAGKKGLEFTENEFKKYKEKLHSKLDEILLLKRNK